MFAESTPPGSGPGLHSGAMPAMLSRRHFLSNTAGGLGGVALAWLLSRDQAKAAALQTARSAYARALSELLVQGQVN